MSGVFLGALAAAIAVSVPVVDTAPAPQNLYMVKGLQSNDGYYTGEFATLHKRGHHVMGAVGAFSSEYFCIRATVVGGHLRGKVVPEGTPFVRRWIGRGDTQRIKGFRRVSKAKMSVYLDGGDPKQFIVGCRG